MTKHRLCNARTAVLTAVLFLAVPLVPTAPAADGEGFLSDVNNTVILDVTTSPATVVAGEYINGTIAYVYVTKLPTDGDYQLVGPDGTVVGPQYPAVDGETLFTDVPLYHTGTWSVVNSTTGTLVSSFLVDVAGAGGSASVYIDWAINLAAKKDYDSGSMFGQDPGPKCYFTGEAHPPGYPISGDYSVRVFAEWQTSFSSSLKKAAFTVMAAGNYGTHATTYTGMKSDSGKVSVIVHWSALRAYDVTLKVNQYYILNDGACYAAGVVMPYA